MLKTTPPKADKLAKLISQKGDFDEDDDLSYVSDYFLNYRNKYDLLQLLKENFTITKYKIRLYSSDRLGLLKNKEYKK